MCFQVNPALLPPCEHYFRSQGFDFKLSNGRVVLVRRTRHISRGRRQVKVRYISCYSLTNERQSFHSPWCLYRMESLLTRVTPCRSFPVRAQLISHNLGLALDLSEWWKGRGLHSLCITCHHRWSTSWWSIMNPRWQKSLGVCASGTDWQFLQEKLSFQ